MESVNFLLNGVGIASKYITILQYWMNQNNILKTSTKLINYRAENTWEPVENLERSQEAISKFMASREKLVITVHKNPPDKTGPPNKKLKKDDGIAIIDPESQIAVPLVVGPPRQKSLSQPTMGLFGGQIQQVRLCQSQPTQILMHTRKKQKQEGKNIVALNNNINRNAKCAQSLLTPTNGRYRGGGNVGRRNTLVSGVPKSRPMNIYQAYLQQQASSIYVFKLWINDEIHLLHLDIRDYKDEFYVSQNKIMFFFLKK
jgi:hypothetical protein